MDILQVKSIDQVVRAENTGGNNLPTDVEAHDHRNYYYNHPHSVFSPTPGVQKLTQAKDYVESLYQNERSPLLYGKNNVIVQPVSSKSSN